MKPIKYVIGDTTKPIRDMHYATNLIIHCCNDKGRWGRGFVVAISKRWKQPEEYYRAWSTGDYRVAPPVFWGSSKGNLIAFPPPQHKPFELGQAQFVPVETDVMVVNMIGQHDTVWIDGVPPVRYDALRSCLKEIAEWAGHNAAAIHAPRFGSALAGGSWDIIEKMIQEELCAKDIDVTIYDLPKTTLTS